MLRRWLLAAAVLALAGSACSAAQPTPTVAPTAAPTPTPTTMPEPTPAPAPTPTATPAPRPTPTVPAPGGQAQQGFLRAALRSEPASFDLVRERDPSAWRVLLPQMSWLVANEQGRRGPTPDLAERWEVSESGTRYAFSLAGGVAWHDGAPFGAEDVVFSLEQARTAVPAPYARTLAAVSEVRAAGSARVEITLSRPDPSFIAGLGAPGNVIFSRNTPADESAGPQPNGTGPYRLLRRLEGIKTVLERNPAYFKKDAEGRRLPYLAGIELQVVDDTNTEWTLMRLGKLDLSTPASPAAWGKSQEDVERRLAGLRTHVLSPVEYTIVFPNRGFWTNPALRRGVRDLVGRRAFHEAVNFNYGAFLGFLMPANGRWAFPPWELAALPGYLDPPVRSSAARQSLAQGGVPTPPHALVRALESDEAVARILYGQIAPFFSQGATLVLDAPASFLATKVALEFDLLLEPAAFRLDDPTATLDGRFRSFGPENSGRWSDPQVDALLDRIAAGMDPPARRADALALQRRLLHLSWAIPLGTQTMIQAYALNVWGTWPPLHLEDAPPYRLEHAWLTA